MERLTIPDVRVDEHTTRRSVIDVAAVREHAMEFYCRLKAYEDTGLTPEEIKAPFTEDTMINLAAQALGVEADRLRELAEADKDGRVVVLPCKVGKKIYYINGKYIIEVEVACYTVDETGAWLFVGETYNLETSGTCHCNLRTERIGKDVFLTREEAERAMEEKRDG